MVAVLGFDSDYVLFIRNIHIHSFISQSADVSRIYLSTRVFPWIWAAQQRICGVYSNTIWKLAFRTTKWIIDTFVSYLSGNLPITCGGEKEFNVRKTKRERKCLCAQRGAKAPTIHKSSKIMLIRKLVAAHFALISLFLASTLLLVGCCPPLDVFLTRARGFEMQFSFVSFYFFPCFFFTISFAKSTTVLCVAAIFKAPPLIQLSLQSNINDVCTVQLITLMLFLIFSTGFKSNTVCLFDFSLFFFVCVPYLWTVSRPVNSSLCVSEEPPSAVQNCSVPCKHQCPVSEWSSWTACLFDNCKDAEGKKGMRYGSQRLDACFILTTKEIILHCM